LREPERQQREDHREQTGAHPGHEIKLEKVPGAPDSLELGPEHPQREHIEYDVEDATVQEHVGRKLPDPERPHDEDRS